MTSWNRPTLGTIYGRIKVDLESRITAGMRINTASLLSALDTTFTGAHHLSFGFLEKIKREAFLATARSFGVERVARQFNMPRYSAAATTGQTSFSGTPGKLVSAGREVVNSAGGIYTTQDVFEIGVDTSVTVQAIEEGAVHNTSDESLTLAEADPDVNSDVTVLEGFDDGRDLEALDNWIARLLFRYQNPPRGGCSTDYEVWARDALPGGVVGRAWNFPAEQWKGASTVGTIVATADLAPLSATNLARVQTYIQTMRPAGAIHETVNLVAKSVQYSINISPNNDTAQAAVVLNLKKLHLAEAKPNGTIKFSHVLGALSASGLDDYVVTDIQVGGVGIGVGNITTEKPNVPTFGTVLFGSV